ncbi:CobQ/CobB/MinD/ParA family nucleotide binding protein [Stackebrandtia albiflava]|uniref:CobQ/CobB/MinD/ParA family nucleotide binding protein n=1 Tax=Stackebrandtia albiflava TaxID=406432 RepID=A0A562URV6_9ACTN|nr:SCO2523 family variant P-loop protein [Stackebrandtia albiflava]TWJ08344.1 CobQ/CobB/MinD/ParA family nucleotide binding protein [Stackebrandtia albiflava]
MLVFATSDKGGTGRSVTSCNLAYQAALHGRNVCYLDFDFGSPTAGTIFNIDDVSQGTPHGGLHAYLRGLCEAPHRVNVWLDSEREAIRRRPDEAGELVLCPGDVGGGEFEGDPQVVSRCADLFLAQEAEFDLTFVDLSAGRSYATQIALQVLAMPALEPVAARWLVFHRWTRQHLLAADGLVNGERGLIKTGTSLGHDEQRLRDMIRFVRTAVVDPDSRSLAGLTAPQVAWLHECNDELHEMAGRLGAGRTGSIGRIPHDPVLQWREQILTNADTRTRKTANLATVRAFVDLTEKLTPEYSWVSL